MTIYCKKFSAISISKNFIQHFRTKHIGIRYHFIRQLVASKIVSLDHVSIKHQLADLVTKPLSLYELRFEFKESHWCG